MKLPDRATTRQIHKDWEQRRFRQMIHGQGEVIWLQEDFVMRKIEKYIEWSSDEDSVKTLSSLKRELHEIEPSSPSDWEACKSCEIRTKCESKSGASEKDGVCQKVTR